MASQIGLSSRLLIIPKIGPEGAQEKQKAFAVLSFGRTDEPSGDVRCQKES
jgi:hypothetical protein